MNGINLELNDSDSYEPITITLSAKEHPIAHSKRVECLMYSGMSLEEAQVEAQVPIELELYYEVGVGLMCVESGAVEAGTIYSPYTSELYK